jgi:DNA-binding NtrC family response regulator
MLIRVVLAVQPPPLEAQIRRQLTAPDVLVEVLPRRSSLWRHIGRRSGDLVIISRNLVTEPPEEAVRTLRNLPEAPFVVILAEQVDFEEQARLMAAGCHAVIHAAINPATLEQALRALLDRRRQESPLTQRLVPGPDDPRLSDFDSDSPRMQAFMATVSRVVGTNTTLLFMGETGVGKERLARAIHAASPRASGPFVSVNCGALPESLLESELFGHEEGAFTGATRLRRGWFEVAHGGTIFLDEIGEMPHHLQVKLLRVLQTREVQRVGSEMAVSIDVRVMAATNRDLGAEVEAGRFRSDLYYRLSVVTLEIPPLRQRPEDIAGLVDNYIDHFRGTFATDVEGIDAEAMEALQDYPWPGNVRELVNIIERAMILCHGRKLVLRDLPETIRRQAPTEAADADDEGGTPADSLLVRPPPDWLSRPLKDVRNAVVADVEQRYLAALLQETGGRIGEAAGRAGIDPRSLYNKMRRYGIDKRRFRPGRTA